MNKFVRFLVFNFLSIGAYLLVLYLSEIPIFYPATDNSIFNLSALLFFVVSYAFYLAYDIFGSESNCIISFFKYTFIILAALLGVSGSLFGIFLYPFNRMEETQILSNTYCLFLYIQFIICYYAYRLVDDEGLSENFKPFIPLISAVVAFIVALPFSIFGIINDFLYAFIPCIVFIPFIIWLVYKELTGFKDEDISLWFILDMLKRFVSGVGIGIGTAFKAIGIGIITVFKFIGELFASLFDKIKSSPKGSSKKSKKSNKATKKDKQHNAKNADKIDKEARQKTDKDTKKTDEPIDIELEKRKIPVISALKSSFSYCRSSFMKLCIKNKIKKSIRKTKRYLTPEEANDIIMSFDSPKVIVNTKDNIIFTEIYFSINIPEDYTEEDENFAIYQHRVLLRQRLSDYFNLILEKFKKAFPDQEWTYDFYTHGTAIRPSPSKPIQDASTNEDEETKPKTQDLPDEDDSTDEKKKKKDDFHLDFKKILNKLFNDKSDAFVPVSYINDISWKQYCPKFKIQTTWGNKIYVSGKVLLNIGNVDMATAQWASKNSREVLANSIYSTISALLKDECKNYEDCDYKDWKIDISEVTYTKKY